MQVRYVPDNGTLPGREGFEEIDEKGRRRRYIRSPGLAVPVRVCAPRIVTHLQITALLDAGKSDNRPAFPGHQYGKDIQSELEDTISGEGEIFNSYYLCIPTLSRLGHDEALTNVHVSLRTREPYLFVDVSFYEGKFYIEANLRPEDHVSLREKLSTTAGDLELSINVGRFPGFCAEWKFDGYDGGTIKFFDREVVKACVENREEIPPNFFDPDEPYGSIAEMAAPHDILRISVVPKTPEDVQTDNDLFAGSCVEMADER